MPADSLDLLSVTAVHFIGALHLAPPLIRIFSRSRSF